ncbi:MAG TPA: homocysteine S-methyltransferase family protein [Anaeromyxobacteraceae bacterium]|jgi:5-methyltetrahydrofolate--homocysteine methyltransferase|nr:homocysteine S-methyltransferase family protein [Anaeromyxobacteraceae bacterium]
MASIRSTGPTLLDGAMGTALQARGLPEGALPEEWLLTRPEEIAAVHGAHAAAGARILLSCTFNCASERPARRGVHASLLELCTRALALARRSVPLTQVAGALGPGDAGAPGRYREAFRALAGAGADLLWAESQREPAEARAALAAAHESRLRVVVTLSPDEREGKLVLPRGEDPAALLRELAANGAEAVGVNCVFLGPALERLLAELAGTLPVPLVVKASAGLPGTVLSPEEWAAGMARLAGLGADWVGGCCGASPAHLAALGLRLG